MTACIGLALHSTSTQATSDACLRNLVQIKGLLMRVRQTLQLFISCGQSHGTLCLRVGLANAPWAHVLQGCPLAVPAERYLRAEPPVRGLMLVCSTFADLLKTPHGRPANRTLNRKPPPSKTQGMSLLWSQAGPDRGCRTDWNVTAVLGRKYSDLECSHEECGIWSGLPLTDVCGP